MRNFLRPYYSAFRPIYVPVVGQVRNLFASPAPPRNDAPRRNLTKDAAPPLASPAPPPSLPPFDTFLIRARPDARLSRFYPRYPFALDRGEKASAYYAKDDPNARYGHEPELAHLIDRLVPDDGVFLDIGSNFGYFSIFLGCRPNFRGRIHAFEPIASSFAGLEEMVTSLKCDNVVACHRAAVSDHVGTARMDRGTDPGLASIKGDDFAAGELVQTVSLDSLKLGRVDFAKIDVEGHENEVLDGAKETIAANHPFIFLESWVFADQPEKVFEPLKFLLARGYELFLPAWMQSNGTFFIGIGPAHEMDTVALVPFALQDRLTFPSNPTNPINIFAAPKSRVKDLGVRWADANKPT